LEEDNGARYAEYEEGIEIPFAKDAMKLGIGLKKEVPGTYVSRSALRRQGIPD
jgi:hypothetical protein